MYGFTYDPCNVFYCTNIRHHKLEDNELTWWTVVVVVVVYNTLTRCRPLIIMLTTVATVLVEPLNVLRSLELHTMFINLAKLFIIWVVVLLINY